jgi:hypothetical protein
MYYGIIFKGSKAMGYPFWNVQIITIVSGEHIVKKLAECFGIMP